MKNLLAITVLTLAVTLPSCGQNGAAPEKVTAAFNQKFPDAKKVKWEMEDETEWEAEFKMNGKEYSANYGLNGEWMETEYEIKEADIPSDIRSILDANFTEYEIEGAEVAETASGKSYEFEIEVGEEEFEVVIDSQGNLTKKKEIEESEENDED